MRTDSTRIADSAQAEAASFIEKEYGKEYLSKAKAAKGKQGAQDAHEAVRPTSVERTPDQMKTFLSRDQYRLYKLIWERFMAVKWHLLLLIQLRQILHKAI